MQKKIIILIWSFLLFLSLFEVCSAEGNEVLVEFFYTDPIKCDACNKTKPLIERIEECYQGKISLTKYFVIDDPNDVNYTKLGEYLDDIKVPTIVIKYQNDQDETIYKWEDIDTPNFEETLKSKINDYINGNISKKPIDNTPGFVSIVLITSISFIAIFLKKKSKKQ